jgi:hypothetical protein
MINSRRLGRATLIVATFLFAIFAAARYAEAQFSSGFTGVVVDQTGAVLVGGKVTVTNQATHIVNSRVSGLTRLHFRQVIAM